MTEGTMRSEEEAHESWEGLHDRYAARLGSTRRRAGASWRLSAGSHPLARTASAPALRRWFADGRPPLDSFLPATVASPHTNRLRWYAERMRRRLTVTVDEETAGVAEAAVAAGRAPSVSAWVASAMAARAQHESLTAVLAQIRAELGPATDEETAWARSVLGL